MAGGKPETLKVLVDSDVIFDFISARLPFYHDAERVFVLAEKGLISIVTLPHLIVNVWQIRAHMRISNKAMHKSLGQLLTLINVLDEPATAITKALMAQSPDFEDRVTLECAIAYKLDAILSRNTKHFRKSPMKVYTPKQFLTEKFSAIN